MSNTDEYDVVVVGSGTGMLAALTAADKGLSVLLVEKSEYVGGSTSLSGGGFWIPGNGLLKKFGQEDTPERIRTYMRAATKGEVADERWESVIQYGPQAVETLDRMTPLEWQFMPEYSDYFPELPGGSATGRAVEPKPFDATRLGEDRKRLLAPVLAAPFPMPITSRGYKWLNLVAREPKGLVTGAHLVGLGVGGMAIKREYLAGGQALAAGLLSGVLAKHIPIWTETPLKDLVEDGGRVTGVVVSHEGQDRTVTARRGVILASGGFDRNAEWRRKYQSPAVDGSWCMGTQGDTGEVIGIAADHGADLAFMDAAWWFPNLPLPNSPSPGPMLAERSLPSQIIVNGHGHRYMNEAVNYMTAGQIMTSRHTPEDPHIPSWIVFDQSYRNHYLFAGSLFPHQPLPKAWYDAGIAHKAPSIGALADQLGMPDLPATVDRFNLLANAGHDDDFGRGDSAYDRYYGDPRVTPNPCLGPIRKPPFYAVQVMPGDLGTCGGVRADRFARALRADGSVIEGLYASGNAAGNAYGRVYPGPGATIGQGLVFGHVAARHAAGDIS